MADREPPRLLTYDEIAALKPGEVIYEEYWHGGVRAVLYCIPVVVDCGIFLVDGVGGSRLIAPDMLLPDDAGSVSRYWSAPTSYAQRRAMPWPNR